MTNILTQIVKVLNFLQIEPNIQHRLTEAMKKYNTQQQEQILQVLIYQFKIMRDVKKGDVQSLQKFVLENKELLENQNSKKFLKELEEELEKI